MYNLQYLKIHSLLTNGKTKGFHLICIPKSCCSPVPAPITSMWVGIWTEKVLERTYRVEKLLCLHIPLQCSKKPTALMKLKLWIDPPVPRQYDPPFAQLAVILYRPEEKLCNVARLDTWRTLKTPFCSDEDLWGNASPCYSLLIQSHCFLQNCRWFYWFIIRKTCGFFFNWGTPPLSFPLGAQDAAITYETTKHLKCLYVSRTVIIFGNLFVMDLDAENPTRGWRFMCDPTIEQFRGSLCLLSLL